VATSIAYAQPELFPVEVLAGFETLMTFTSVNLDENRARFYTLRWQTTLWGEQALIQTWGRRGTIGRTRVTNFADRAAAHPIVVDIIRHRIRHGYEIVTWM